jgi:cell division protein FtsQ
MKYKAIILRVLGILLWVAIGAGITVLLVSAVQKEQSQKCTALEIAFTDNKPFRMLDESEITEALWPSSHQDKPVGKFISSINLFSIEKQLKKNPWVFNANIYFDQRDILHIDVEQRSPVARVFSPEGNSFYIDDSLYLLPLKTSVFVELPVFTNFKTFGVNASDSIIKRRITSLSAVIRKDPFWMAQIEQINIDGDGGFEMITQLGDHRINLGTQSNWEDMLKKLKKLYHHLAAEQALTKYEFIDLQFKDQVVCVRRSVFAEIRDSIAGSDSIRTNITLDTLKSIIQNNSNNKIKAEKIPL